MMKKYKTKLTSIFQGSQISFVVNLKRSVSLLSTSSDFDGTITYKEILYERKLKDYQYRSKRW